MSRSRTLGYRSALAVLVFLSGAVISASAQQAGGPTPAEDRLAWYERHVGMKDSSLFKNVQWQFVGPTNVSGRMTDIAVVEPRGENYTVFVAGASGGVWRTKNEGTTWEPVFEHGASTSIGDVTIAPSNPNIVWVGTGEGNIFRSSMAGAGVYKSTDGGDSWEHKGLAATHTIPRIVIHPTNPDVLYVAASGREWTDNPERGVYKSTDGGDSWELVLFVSERTGAIDLVMDPSDPNRLYAATWQRIRKKWNDPRNEAGYSESGIYRTDNGGADWQAINDGLPEPHFRGRIGIDVARSNPSTIYAFVDSYDVARVPEGNETDSYGRPLAPVIRGATVFRSDDRGDTWRQASETNEHMERLNATYGWVFGQMRVDPNDAETIYVMGLGLNVSNDGGKTFRRLSGMHGDHHGLWIDPQNSNYLINVNDGGVDILYDAGENWKNFNDNLSLVQFFNIGYDMDEPFNVYGSVQDHGSYRGPIDLRNGRDEIPAAEFARAPGGEGSSHAIDPTNPNRVYSAGFYGSITRTDLETGERVSTAPQAAEGELPLRGQWVAPFIISPHNPRIIYHGFNKLFRSMDLGDSWEQISPDLTYNELELIGDIPYQTIFSIAESPLKFGLIYAGTDDGRIWVTKSSGGEWSEITGNLPAGKFTAELVASAYDEATVYLAQNGKREDDFMPYLWKSADYGASWENIAANIPSGPVNVIREDPENENLLYVGTDLGVYASISGGEDWQVLPGGLPTTFIHDLIIHPRDRIMVAASHGRGMWALDISKIEQLTGEVLAKRLHVFDVDAGRVRRGQFGFGFGAGTRPVYVHYYMSTATDVKVEIRDADGGVIAELEATGDAGLNRARWDLQRQGQAEAAGPQRGRGSPFVAAGTYTVVVTAGGESAEKTVEVGG